MRLKNRKPILSRAEVVRSLQKLETNTTDVSLARQAKVIKKVEHLGLKRVIFELSKQRKAACRGYYRGPPLGKSWGLDLSADDELDDYELDDYSSDEDNEEHWEDWEPAFAEPLEYEEARDEVSSCWSVVGDDEESVIADDARSCDWSVLDDASSCWSSASLVDTSFQARMRSRVEGLGATQCSICFEQLRAGAGVFVPPCCRTVLCEGCLLSYLTVTLGDWRRFLRPNGIACPTARCGGRLALSDAQRVLPAPLFDRLIDGISEVARPITIALANGPIEMGELDPVVRWAISSGSRQCPSCLVRIEKNGGCDHMECSFCGFQFNWGQAVNRLCVNKLKLVEHGVPHAFEIRPQGDPALARTITVTAPCLTQAPDLSQAQLVYPTKCPRKPRKQPRQRRPGYAALAVAPSRTRRALPPTEFRLTSVAEGLVYESA
mmetsp:Transcript_5965/g.13566  ORF Transcript_5965/g.13566 Transcript_5965/m.13566 type:complete len:435 (+) Transcript_5965:69-1373(+)